MSPADPCSPDPADGVQLIDKNQRRCIFLAFSRPATSLKVTSTSSFSIFWALDLPNPKGPLGPPRPPHLILHPFVHVYEKPDKEQPGQKADQSPGKPVGFIGFCMYFHLVFFKSGISSGSSKVGITVENTSGCGGGWSAASVFSGVSFLSGAAFFSEAASLSGASSSA